MLLGMTRGEGYSCSREKSIILLMDDSSGNTLLVELFLPNGRLQGLTHEVRDRRRLVDVLSEPANAFRLASAKVVLGSAATVREFPSLNFEKRTIIAAIPHETQQQQRQRSMLTSTVGKSLTHTIQATLLLPPFIAAGSVHVPHSVGNIGSKLTADPQIFARFISVTGAKLTLPGGAEVEAQVLLVNRDLIAGISVIEERGHLERGASRTRPETEDSLQQA
jgi:hypothetical protein